MKDDRSESAHQESRAKRPNHDQNTKPFTFEKGLLKRGGLVAGFVHHFSHSQESSAPAHSLCAVLRLTFPSMGTDYRFFFGEWKGIVASKE